VSEYSSAIDLAARLIIKKGREVIFRHKVAAPTDGTPSGADDEPWNKADPSWPTQKLKMVFLDYEQKEIDGTNIKSGDKKVLMFAKGVKYQPNTSDQIVELPKHGGKTWNIVDVDKLQPGEEVVMYTLQVRR